MTGHRREDWYADSDVDRLHIFVPAVMGAGIALSLYTLVRDAVHARRRRSSSRRVTLEAHATARQVVTGGPADEGLLDGLRPRISYLVTALAAAGLAMYVGIGATANYLNPVGYIRDIAWLWAVSLAATALFGLVAAVAGISFVTWPRIPRWQRPLLARTPLGQRPSAPHDADLRPSPLLGWAAATTGATAALVVLMMARAPYMFAAADTWFHDTARGWDWADDFEPLDLFGRTSVSVLLVVVIGLGTLRCVPFALAYLGSVAAGLLVDTAVKAVVDRPRPPSGVLAHWTDSFPSGHLIQATLIAGLVPMAVLVLFRRRWLAWGAFGVLGYAVAATTAMRLYRGVHWWSDAVGGVLIGTTIVLTVLWILGHGRWHRHCDACPWHRTTDRAGRRREPLVLLPMPVRRRLAVRRVSRLSLLAAVAVLAGLALTVGVPRNPDGDGLVSQLERPVQLGLLVLAAVAWAVSWRWDAPAAVLLALVGNALGVLSALAYQPLVSMLIAAAFLLPAAGLWLAWQHGRTRTAVAAVAAVTVVLCAGTWAGASAAYARFFGPAHPQSTAALLPVDRVVWMWSGGVTGTSATVVAELARGRRAARLVLRTDAGGAEVATAVLPAGPGRVVRLTAAGLRPDTSYSYVLDVDGSPDRSRGVGRLRTVPTGPASFIVALGSCARTGSNGAVFDAIAAVDPLLYLQTGDLHYGNPAAADPALFSALYRRVLTAPAQAALYRSVPVSYVWDDHDYGPNDADSTAPTRAVARAAYRRHVPHHPLPAGDDGAIYQAFSVGRVRFVLTDTRSERTGATMLGAPQLAWLENELVTSARTHALVVWVNPDPWIAAPDPAADNWGAYPAERRHLADVVAGAGIRNLVMVAGDAHMVAIDDGSHTGYGTGGSGGFPLLHAAALDRPGNVKGGPYSEGAFPGGGQFGTLSVVDSGGPTVDVELAGRNWRGETLVAYRTTVTVPA